MKITLLAEDFASFVRGLKTEEDPPPSCRAKYLSTVSLECHVSLLRHAAGELSLNQVLFLSSGFSYVQKGIRTNTGGPCCQWDLRREFAVGSFKATIITKISATETLEAASQDLIWRSFGKSCKYRQRRTGGPKNAATSRCSNLTPDPQAPRSSSVLQRTRGRRMS